jgi:hypothetical protein
VKGHIVFRGGGRGRMSAQFGFGKPVTSLFFCVKYLQARLFIDYMYVNPSV